MGDPARDLAQWIPRLIAVWRRHRKAARAPQHGKQRRFDEEELPEGNLTHDELREVGAGVKQLSMGLTRDRALAGARYMDDPKLLGAYLLFYWPVSYAQARSTFSELTSRPRSVMRITSPRVILKNSRLLSDSCFSCIARPTRPSGPQPMKRRRPLPSSGSETIRNNVPGGGVGHASPFGAITR